MAYEINLPDYYSDFQQAEKDGRRRGSISAGAAYARGGDYDNAVKATEIYAPDAAAAYQHHADDSYDKKYAGALASEDFKGAAQIAGAAGKPQGVIAAQGALQQKTAQKLATGQRLAESWANEAQSITQIKDPAQRQAATDALKTRAIQETVANGDPPDHIAQLFGDQYDPMLPNRLAGTFQKYSDTIAQQLAQSKFSLDQDQAAETHRHNVEDENTARASAGGQNFRPLSAAEAGQYGIGPDDAKNYQVNGHGQVVPVRQQKQNYYPDTAALAGNYAKRLNDADATISTLQSKVDPNIVYTVGQLGGGGPDVQRMRQAQREFVNAALRKESGAAISNAEFDSAKQQYFPVPGDSPQVIAQKAAARQRTLQGMKHESQGYYDEMYGGGAPAAGPAGAAPAMGGAPPVHQLTDAELAALAAQRGIQ